MSVIKFYLKWIIFAFLIGIAMSGGTKVCDTLWPDTPMVIEHKLIEEK